MENNGAVRYGILFLHSMNATCNYAAPAEYQQLAMRDMNISRTTVYHTHSAARHRMCNVTQKWIIDWKSLSSGMFWECSWNNSGASLRNASALNDYQEVELSDMDISRTTVYHTHSVTRQCMCNVTQKSMLYYVDHVHCK